jgi:PhoH-like ATPase
VRMENGGILRVEMYEESVMKTLPPELREERGDNRILAVAMKLMKRKDATVIFVTKDINLRIKADAIGMTAQDYESDKVSFEELYTGFSEIDIAPPAIDTFYGQGFLEQDGEAFQPNHYLVLRETGNPSHTAICRYDQSKKRLVPTIRLPRDGIWGIHPRNKEQSFALDALMDDNVKLVTLVGKAGTGKTLLAIAAGLHKTAEENIYHRLLVSRPVFPMGKDIGFLPGDIEEKLAPWMQPIFDNVELLLSGHEGEKRHSKGYKELMSMGIMEIEPLTYIRGRSIPNQYMIVDEAQNLTPHEIKTIITRAGEGTKIVLTGDPYQIDNPYVDASSNGLTYVVEKFKQEEISAHVLMTKGERSQLAELAANLL